MGGVIYVFLILKVSEICLYAKSLPVIVFFLCGVAIAVNVADCELDAIFCVEHRLSVLNGIFFICQSFPAVNGRVVILLIDRGNIFAGALYSRRFESEISVAFG